jgi:uncharacterized membrane protein YidH (DUF202 family)
MPSVERGAMTDPHSKAGVLVRLLDPAFGFFVWSIHFLVVYIAAAVLCVLGLDTAGEQAQRTFIIALGMVTVVAAAILLVHGIWRYRKNRDLPDQRFRMSVTVGGDAIAAVATLWQFFPILLVPVCA